MKANQFPAFPAHEFKPREVTDEWQRLYGWRDNPAWVFYDLVKPKPRCCHALEYRREGPRVPASYGSWATEVCGKCEKWHYNRGGCKGDEKWRKMSDLLLRDRTEDWS